MNRHDWRNLLRQWFEVPGYPDVFVLGSFARYVTLYSQQVRALNLVAGLCSTGVIASSRDIAVIGGGVAGVTAAAAAAHKGAHVMLLEASDELINIQLNNRQRWLHPHIYDWPRDHEGDESRLPLLPWRADYSYLVAENLRNQFEEIAKSAYIDTRRRAKAIHIRPGLPPRLLWNDEHGHHSRAFSGIILAVGFGLEQQNSFSRSYWQEDDLDTPFGVANERWLISGFGDGALTDLMRLCISNFRHADLRSMFSTAAGIAGIKDDLERIHSHPRAMDPGWLSAQFAQLPSIDDLAKHVRPNLEHRLRTRIEVSLAGKSLNMYDPGASILNRLVVRVLAALNAFRLLHGPVEHVEPCASGVRVRLYGSGVQEFDHVVLRHGPESALKSSFPLIAEACEEMDARWKALPRADDLTRRRLWSYRFFGNETNPYLARIPPEEDEFKKSAEPFGIYADLVSMFVEVREDGSTQFLYQIDGLSVCGDKQLDCIHFKYESTVGQIGPLEVDDLARQRRIRWRRDPASQGSTPSDPATPSNQNHAANLDSAKERARKISGKFYFDKPLKGRESVSFGFRLALANCNATSKWEFDQFYPAPKDQEYPTGDPLPGHFEYVARLVYFPVKRLRIRLTLPNRSPGPPALKVFQCRNETLTLLPEVVFHDGELHNFARQKARVDPKDPKWQAVDLSTVQPYSIAQLATQTWELLKDRPPVGSLFLLEWPLAATPIPAEFKPLENEAKLFRKRLLSSRRQLRLLTKTSPPTPARDRFIRFVHAVEKRYAPGDEADGLEVSWFTYDEEGCENDGQRCVLRLVDGRFKGCSPNENDWNFWLPFGVGQAGACFKGGKLLVYSRRAADQGDSLSKEPNAYLPMSGNKHAFLVSIPLDHPSLSQDLLERVGLDRSRQCLGVINIGSSHEHSRFEELLNEQAGSSELLRLLKICKHFSDEMHEMFSSPDALP
jgi:hypothetical protein